MLLQDRPLCQRGILTSFIYVTVQPIYLAGACSHLLSALIDLATYSRPQEDLDRKFPASRRMRTSAERYLCLLGRHSGCAFLLNPFSNATPLRCYAKPAI